MIAVDTSSLVAYFGGDSGADVDWVDEAMGDKQVALPPVVLTEILSQPGLPKDFLTEILQIPVLSIDPGLWSRAGLLRAKVLTHGHKARIADALIAQNCLDHRCQLITRDRDFQYFEKLGGLRIFKR